MNARERRKSWRLFLRTTGGDFEHRYVRDWQDLADLPESATHRLEIDVEGCNGWIHRKDGNEYMGHYLSTHTFYGRNHRRSTALLRRCGFNVTVDNWDK
jgi:hypothetical protein